MLHKIRIFIFSGINIAHSIRLEIHKEEKWGEKKLMSGVHNLIDSSLAHKLRLDTISNNLANINTNAFKKDVISFNQVLTMKNTSAIDLTPGPIRYTGNKFDVALGSPGFFKIQTSRGIRYTRDGSFTLNEDGLLVTQNGDTVLGQNGPIRINGSNVSMNIDGQVLVENEPVDRILVMDFRQPRLLRKEGSSSYIYQGEERDIFAAENVSVQQGYTEGSNVSPIQEMIKMVEALRAFESAQKAIQCMDEITDKMVNDPGLLQ